MMTTGRHAAGFLAVVGSCAILLAGCGFDDVELNGKIFDAVGMSPATKSKGKDPKLAERAPLVVPPTLDKLPEPGSAAATDATIAEVNDHDRSKVANAEEKQRQQAEYCKVHYEQAKARGDNDADLAAGPLGPCRGSVFTALKKWTGQDEGQDEQ